MPDYLVTNPEGKKFKVTAPEGATQDEALEYAKQQFGQPQEQQKPQEQGYLGKLGDVFEKRGEEVGKTAADFYDFKLLPHEAVVQTLGKGIAGTALDVIGVTGLEILKGGGKVASFLIPDSIEDPVKEQFKKGWETLVGTDTAKELVKIAGQGQEAWNEYKKYHPQDAKNIESAINIGLLLAPAKTKAKAGPTKLGKAAGAIQKSAEKSAIQNRAGFIEKLITPERTKKVLVDEVARTTEKGVGPFKTSVVKLTPREAEVAAEVTRIAGVGKKHTVQQNYNIIADHNIKLAQKLEQDLGKRRLFTSSSQVSKNIDDAVTKLVQENPVIVGNAEKTAQRIAQKAKELVKAQPQTPQGILKARKELDAWVRSQKGSKIFDPEMENTLSVSVRTVRQSMNDSISKYVPGVKVKSELKRQSLLYDALENMGPKAAIEKNSAIARAWQNAVRALPFRGVANQELALAFGIGGLGAAALFAPWVSGALGLTLTGLGIRKAIISPSTRAGLAKLIKTVDRAILSSKNPSMIKQLRADRAVIVDIVKNAEVSKEDE